MGASDEDERLRNNGKLEVDDGVQIWPGGAFKLTWNLRLKKSDSKITTTKTILYKPSERD